MARGKRHARRHLRRTGAREGALAEGHPAGVAGVVGHGGWLAIPLALAVGALVAAAARGAEALETLGDPRPIPALRLPAPPLVAAPGRAVAVVGGRVLARHLAGRAPPALSV